MSLLERRKERGFWRKKTPTEATVEIDQASLDELKEKGSVVIESGGSRFQVIIVNENWKESGEEISEGDLDIIPLPKAARPASN